MPRFYCNQPLETGMLLTLPESVSHHVQVLRLSEGDVITVFNGSGGEYSASIERMDKKRVHVLIKAFSAREIEPAHGLTLAQAHLRAGRSLKSIAHELGYANPSALSRVFAQKLGMSARDWREAVDEGR